MPIRPYEDKLPDVHPTAYVDETALVIGDVRIGEDSSIWPMTVVRGDIHRIEIGSRTNIQDGSVLHVTHDSTFKPGGSPLIIGDDVTVGHGVVLHACTLESYCLIGIGTVLLDGAIVREKAMIGAGTLVTPDQELTGGYLWVGRPAKRVRALTEQELAYLEYVSANYVKIKNKYTLEPEP